MVGVWQGERLILRDYKGLGPMIYGEDYNWLGSGEIGCNKQANETKGTGGVL